MDHTPENHLQQATKLARQAAAQMRKAAALAEQAAQLFQAALAQIEPAGEIPTSVDIDMTITGPKRQKKPRLPATTAKLGEKNTMLRSIEGFPALKEATEPASSAPANAWDDGDDWWKPLQPASSSRPDSF
jgi:hypothetical protein